MQVCACIRYDLSRMTRPPFVECRLTLAIRPFDLVVFPFLL